MKYFWGIITFALLFCVNTSPALAVPPPDFLFNVGSQLIQIFSVLAVFLSALAISAWQVLKVYFHKFKHRKAVWAGLGLAVVVISFSVAYFSQQYQQDKAYREWIAQSEQANAALPATDNPLDQLKLNGAHTTVATTAGTDLTAGTDTSSGQAPAGEAVQTDDKYESFLRTYYDNLANGKIEEAYAVSKKSVSLKTYKSWYENVQEISIDFIQLISDHRYSLQLSLDDGETFVRYAVLTTLADDDAGGIRIVESEVRTLSTKPSQLSSNVTADTTAAADQPQSPLISEARVAAPPTDLPLAISNADFEAAARAGKIYVLDAREDEEFDIGNYPGSIHIRSADLVAGEWIQLPTDQVIYVFCWSGMRGKDVAEFLRTKNLAARYVENGASDWVAFGGKWDGEISFLSRYGADQYTRLFTLAEVKDFIAEGIVLVDSRPAAKFDNKHIPGSINIPMIYTPTSQVEEALAKVPAGADVITICDDFVSCFDAKVTGIKLEKQGHSFLGRYNKPWEYQN